MVNTTGYFATAHFMEAESYQYMFLSCLSRMPFALDLINFTQIADSIELCNRHLIWMHRGQDSDCRLPKKREHLRQFGVTVLGVGDWCKRKRKVMRRRNSFYALIQFNISMATSRFLFAPIAGRSMPSALKPAHEEW
jgi:hypothetical protein